MAETMKAAVVHEFGEPLAIGHVPVPGGQRPAEEAAAHDQQQGLQRLRRAAPRYALAHHLTRTPGSSPAPAAASGASLHQARLPVAAMRERHWR